MAAAGIPAAAARGARSGTPAPSPPRAGIKHDVRFAKFVVILNGLVPGALLAWDAYHHQIGANGVNYALHTTGLLSFIFLLLTLLVTPLRKLTGWNSLISFRRALGLYAFVYASVHFLIFFAFDRAGSVTSTVHEVLFRRYLQIGTVGLLLMVPLALTSTNAVLMRLGAKRWKRLHRLTYLVAIAAAVHYYLLVKSDVRQPLAFAGVLTLLLGYRLLRYGADRRQAREAMAMRAKVGRLAPSPAAAKVRPAQPAAAKPRFWTGQLRVARLFDETPDVRTFRLVPEDGGELPFAHQPGQYLNLVLTVGGKRVNRSYTIASSPTQGHYCEVTVKRSATGYGSCHLHDSIPAGALLNVSAPAGRFVFTGGAVDRVVLIAGGVGITPLMSMIRFLTDRCWPGDIYLLFSVRKQSDLIFREELTYLERRFPNLHVCATLTKEDPPDWRGARGPITRDLLTHTVPDLLRAPVYLCGPDAMMTATRNLLVEMGMPPGQIHTEAFVSPPTSSPEVSSPVPSASDVDLVAAVDGMEVRPPSGAGAAGEGAGVGVGTPPGEGIRMTFQRSGQIVETLLNQTVLETAEAAGVDIPFECRSGICGQCKTRLLAGRVTMEWQDALSAGEKASGLILACQAHAVGDITLDA